MRLMDGLIGIPAILLAIALVSLFRGGLVSVIIAIIIPEIPRVVPWCAPIVLSCARSLCRGAIMAGSARRCCWCATSSEHDSGPHRGKELHLRQRHSHRSQLSFLHRYSARDADLGNIMAEGAGLFRIYPPHIFLSRHLPCADRACRPTCWATACATGSIRNLQGGCK